MASYFRRKRDSRVAPYVDSLERRGAEFARKIGVKLSGELDRLSLRQKCGVIGFVLLLFTGSSVYSLYRGVWQKESALPIENISVPVHAVYVPAMDDSRPDGLAPAEVARYRALVSHADSLQRTDPSGYDSVLMINPDFASQLSELKDILKKYNNK